MKAKKKTMMAVAVVAMGILFGMGVFIPRMISAGELEPGTTPADGGTMYTLEEVYKAITPLPTGFELWPDNPRFAVSDVDGIVLDRATGLMWARDANLDGTKLWQEARGYCDGLGLGGRTDWRLPDIEELKTLSEPSPSSHNPALPEGHPFNNVQSDGYWSGTNREGSSIGAWQVSMTSGSAVYCNKIHCNRYVWPVRG
ncbi:MAG: DUF1566 domain-containing protein, partial [Planctomycetes bacterium]|nr:DUF1566 domain-containing protein [Planctomycetota bacterium]